MRAIKKILAVILMINIVLGLFPGLGERKAHAEDLISLNVVSYISGKATFSWNLSGVKSVVVSYHAPQADNSATEVVLQPINTTSSVTVENLKSDYIYDIHIKMYEEVDGTGLVLGSGSTWFLPQISFYSSIVNQQTILNSAGGSESGAMPSLKVSWKLPRIYDGISSFIPMNTAAAFSKLGAVNKLNYKISVTDSSNRADIDIVWNRNSSGNKYTASVAGDSDEDRISEVAFDSSTNRYYFYLLGIKEEGVHVPTIAEVMSNSYNDQAVLPKEISDKPGERNYVIPDGDILPGTVYYLKVNPFPADSNNNYVSCMTTGPNGSSLLGSFSYIYTPIRFELTKDALDNINVKIYKVNKGNLNMPQLYYEVQMNSIPDDQDSTWNQGPFKDKGKKLDGTYFTGAYAYAVITGISPNNTVYYRILVKSNSSNDRLESLKMAYTLKNDVSKPPIPKNVNASAGKPVIQGVNKSSDVVITWDKPANWAEMKTNADMNTDTVFHFLVSTNQAELGTLAYPLESEGKLYGNFPVKYRRIQYISARSPEIKEDGDKLKYTIKAFDLFKGWYWAGGSSFAEEDLNNPAEEDADGNEYPEFLLPNKVYYLQVYTTKAEDRNTEEADRMSGKSLTVSFTTPTSTEKDVPPPTNFKNSDTVTPKDTVNLQFDKVQVNWDNYTANHTQNDAVYYDLYMSTRSEPSSFVLIGTTDMAESTEKDVIFSNVKDSQSVFIKAKIDKFTQGRDVVREHYTDSTVTYNPYEVFGAGLTPNSTYYFIVKTRVYVENPLFNMNPSVSTVVLPVTTGRGGIGDPDDTAKKPLAPEDFDVAKDTQGNALITGQTVTFKWTKREEGVRYSLICTSQKVAQNAPVADYENDPIYQSFMSVLGLDDHNADGGSFTLDPSVTINDPYVKFSYDSNTKVYTLMLGKWISPNKLYYFSLRAEKADGTPPPSVWVSIPVTTALVEAPTMLAPVNDLELGFTWNGKATLLTDDYRIYMKGPGDSDYKLLAKTQYTAVKNGTTFYGRVYKLKPKSLYSIRVIENGNSAIVYENTGHYTRDDNHQIEVMWKGLPLDNYSKFEIAIKTEDQAEYTVLEDMDLEGVTRFYSEKTPQLLNTGYFMYYARIKTAAIKYSDGSVIHQPLKANTKYYIKVRVVKYDSITSVPAYSKYAGPVDTRTEFNQDDYDEEDDDLNNKATFLDRITKLEEKPYWRVTMSSTTANKILLKGDKMVNIIENSSGLPFTLDISSLGPNINADVIYMPVSVARVLYSSNKSLVVKTYGAEFTIRPRTLNIDNAAETETIKNKQGVKDIFVKVTVTRSEYPASSIPANTKRLSKVNDFDLEVVGSSKTDKQLKEDFHDRVYNDKTGLVKQKLDLMALPYNDNTSTKEKLNKYMDQLVKETESELSDYIGTTVEGVNGSTGMIVAKEYIKSFDMPMLVKLSYTAQKGLIQPYVYYDGSSAWSKITKELAYSASSAITFSVGKTGKYAVFASVAQGSDISNTYWAKASIDKFTSKYDLSDIFAGVSQSFNPETSVSAKEMVLIYEKVMNKAESNTGFDIKQKTKTMALDSIVNLNNLNKDIAKQEAAALLIKVYSAKSGLDYARLRPSRNIFVEDDREVANKFYNQVLIAIDLKVLTLDSNGNFQPLASVTRAQAVDAFVKVLELAGEI